ncbi:putative aconitase [Thelonectria olida]|uniref:Aconitate hydratase, mitochondrial n=1 Tax=Thelonectria olida TaxID=1576542 RepID=A0A9P8W4A7_9HYPO|nr:putative aconitase [Thelonectria olida]
MGVRPGLSSAWTKALCSKACSRRTLATASNVSSTAKLSRFEPNHTIDYADLVRKIEQSRNILQRPLSYAEKILFSYTDNLGDGQFQRGKTQLKLRPRRIACQDATAQMALIQFMSAGLDSTAVPTTIHCDHLIVGKNGHDTDLPNALNTHSEVYDFMSSAAKRYSMGFWKPGAGIIHQTVLENYAFPGGLMVGTDSHTPNAGGLGMIAIGVGGADAVDVMAGLHFELTAPKIIGVRLTGRLSGWATPKDIINTLAGILTVKGGTGSIVEFFGPGVNTISCTGMASICNMGAETGATTSVFPFTEAMSRYLEATHRDEIAQAVRFASHELRADSGVEYDRVVEIDLSSLEPTINGPFTPDLSTPLSKFAESVHREAWPRNLTAGLIGSCTNSSFEDVTRAADVAKQALNAGLTPKMPLLLSPGSEQTRQTLEDSGALETFAKLESTLLTNACGPCCGSWDRQDMKKGTENSIITSYNRNFTGRLDGNPATNIFLASPEIVMAKIFSDDLSFDPTKDSLRTPNGEEFRFQPPSGESLPSNGYANTDHVYSGPPSSGREAVEIQISDTSERLQRLAPFPRWSGSDHEDCVILIKAKGKCTTDHITPAGPWFRYRGHLENISNNTLIGAVNAETGKVNTVRNWLTGEEGDVPGTAKTYRQLAQPWVVIGDHNYGEGSSREHAALQPRYLGCVAIVAKSFARIHETNLKKQGVLALTFVKESDYDRIKSSDRISIVELKDLAVGKPVTIKVSSTTDRASVWATEVSHTMTQEQIEYFKAGSALNLMAERKNNPEVTL